MSRVARNSRPDMAGVGAGVIVVGPLTRASRKAPAVAKRSTGNLASACSKTRASHSGTPGRTRDTEGTCW